MKGARKELKMSARPLKRAAAHLRSTEDALRESEDRFRATVDHFPYVYVLYGPDLRFRYVNRAGLVLSGLRLDQLLGRRDDEVFPPAVTGTYMPFLRRCLRTRQRQTFEITCELPGGCETAIVDYVPLLDEQGKVRQVFGIATDITERKRMEDQLTILNAELDAKVKERTDALRSLAAELTVAEHKERRRIALLLHEDLQQRLAAIKYKVQGLRDGVQGVSALRAADRAIHELTEAIELTRDLTTRLVPPVLYQLGLRPALDTLAKEMMAHFSLSVRITGLRDFRLPSDAMGHFAFDAVRELLLNVHKHAGVKSAEIRIRSAGEKRISVAVCEKGKGIPLNHRKAAHFGHFSIRERAEAMGIGFTISSRPGKWTCVALVLPVL